MCEALARSFTPENSPGVMEWLRAIQHLQAEEGLFDELPRPGVSHPDTKEPDHG